MECDAAFYTCPSHSQRFWASGCIHISPYQTWELWNVAQPPLVCAALVHGQSLWSAQNETAAPSALFPSGWLRSVPASPAPFPSQSLSSGEGIKETNLAQVLFLTATARLQWAWNQKMPQTHTHTPASSTQLNERLQTMCLVIFLHYLQVSYEDWVYAKKTDFILMQNSLERKH